ncbi:hypothetical protein TNCV_4196331 [Trichonephila clavipes]|nr:hypothetical protein TNCV_4196331 [Trichonephila clavipes]
MLPRSNESQYSRKNGPGERCEEKGTGLKKDRGYKRSINSGSAGPERKYRKGPREQGAKPKLTSINSNDLPYFRKRCRRDETVMTNTSGYNLRPRRGSKKSSGHPVRRGHNKEDQFDPEETENNSTAPTPSSNEGQTAGVPEAEEFSNNIARRGQDKRTV